MATPMRPLRRPLQRLRSLTALLAVAAAFLLSVPAAQAGSAETPEVEDAANDGGIDHLDIQKVWVDTQDELNLTFHLVLGAELPATPTTSNCDGDDCTFTSLTYRVIFRVLAADGTPAPDVAGYNRSYVAYRHGPNGTLLSPVGTYDDGNVLTLHGSANVTVDGAELVLSIPRTSPAVNMPLGPQPGTRIEGLYAYDSPQACEPNAGCAPIAKVVVNSSATPPTVTQVVNWDRAPDAGSASAQFPAPPPSAPPTSPSPAPAAPQPTTAPAPATPSPTPSTRTTSTSDTATVPDSDSSGTQGPKESPGPGLVPVLAFVLAVVARRRC